MFPELPSVRRLVDRSRAILGSIFGTDDPAYAETNLAPDLFKTTVKRARRTIESDDGISHAWHGVLEEIALDLAEMYGDRLRLRIVPSRESMLSPIGMPLRAHRDTWGSGVMAQVNWWLPLYPLEPSRTMLVWPDKFETPVANTSHEWDYGKLVAQRSGGTCNYPLLPVARTSPSPRKAIAVLIQPGELLAFSGAHLHGSVRDDTGLSRFSLDTRTVWHKDITCGRGARNVDGATRRPHWEWFARFSDGASLAVPRDGSSSPNVTTVDEKPRQTHGVTH